MKIPILISNNVKLRGLKRGRVILNLSDNQRILFGFGGSDGIVEEKSCIFLNGGKLIFNGSARFATGCRIRVDSGTLIFGSNFSANKNCFFSCSDKITIGDDVLFG